MWTSELANILIFYSCWVIMVDGMKRTNLQTLCVCLILFELHIMCIHLEIFFFMQWNLSYNFFLQMHARTHIHALRIHLKMLKIVHICTQIQACKFYFQISTNTHAAPHDWVCRWRRDQNNVNLIRPNKTAECSNQRHITGTGNATRIKWLRGDVY